MMASTAVDVVQLTVEQPPWDVESSLVAAFTTAEPKSKSTVPVLDSVTVAPWLSAAPDIPVPTCVTLALTKTNPVGNVTVTAKDMVASGSSVVYVNVISSAILTLVPLVSDNDVVYA